MKCEFKEEPNDMVEEFNHLDISLIPENEKDEKRIKFIEEDDFYCEIFLDAKGNLRILF